MILLDGEKIAREIRVKLKERTSSVKLGLSVVQVGNNPVSTKYIEVKRQIAEDLGVSFFLHHFPASISENDLKEAIQKIAEGSRISGIIVQLPLPSTMNMQSVLDAVPFEKDVDVLSSAAFESFASGNSSILPPTVCAIATLFSEYGIEVSGKNVVVVGAGRLVGVPLVAWFKQKGVNVKVVTSSTQNIKELTKLADIIISGVGKANLITGDMIKEGAVVFDAGTSVEDGETKGDVDFESVSRVAGYIAPVPGGVGPLTAVCLFKNLLKIGQ